jgi:hypothetical protein
MHECALLKPLKHSCEQLMFLHPHAPPCSPYQAWKNFDYETAFHQQRAIK